MYSKTSASLLMGATLFAFSACTTQQQVSSESVQACVAKLPNSQLIKKQAITTGCIVSAVIWKTTGIGSPTVLVCLAGGGAGYLLGKSIAERKCSYRLEGDQINKEISHIESINRNFPVLYTDKAKQLVKQQATVSSLLAKHKEGKAKLAAINAVKKEISSAAETERYLVGMLNKDLVFKTASLARSRLLNKTNNTKKLQKEIALLQKNIRILREENKKLYRLESQLSGL